MYAESNSCAMCAMCSIGFGSKPPRVARRLPKGVRGQEATSLEAGSSLGKVFLAGEANAGNPAVGVGVEALEDAELVLLLNQLAWGQALELLAKVEPANFSVSTVEEEEHVLLLILDSVELAGTSGIGCIVEAHTLGQIGD